MGEAELFLSETTLVGRRKGEEELFLSETTLAHR